MIIAGAVLMSQGDRRNDRIQHTSAESGSIVPDQMEGIEAARAEARTPVTDNASRALTVLSRANSEPVARAALFAESGKVATAGLDGKIALDGEAEQFAGHRVFAPGFLPSTSLHGEEQFVYLEEDPGILARATQVGVEAKVLRTIRRRSRESLDEVELRILEEIDAMEFEVTEAGEVLVPGWPCNDYVLLRQIGPGESAYSAEVEPCVGEIPRRRYVQFREFWRNSPLEFWMYQLDGTPAEGLAVDVQGEIDWWQRAIVEKDGRVAVNSIPSGRWASQYLEVWADVDEDWRYYDTVWLKDPAKRVSRMSVREFSVNVIAPPDGLELEVASAADSHPEVTDRLIGTYPGPKHLKWIPVESEGLTPISAGVFGEGTCVLIRDAASESPFLAQKVVPGQTPVFDLREYGALELTLNNWVGDQKWRYWITPIQSANNGAGSLSSVAKGVRRKVKGDASQGSKTIGLLAGLYSVAVNESNGPLIEAGEVRIEPGVVASMVVERPEKIDVAVRVVTPNGAPVPGAFVEFVMSERADERALIRSETDQGGWCRRSVPGTIPFVRAASTESRRPSGQSHLVRPVPSAAVPLPANSEVVLQLDVAWIRIHSVPDLVGWHESERHRLAIRSSEGRGALSLLMSGENERLLQVRPGEYTINLYSGNAAVLGTKTDVKVVAVAGEVVDFDGSERFPLGLSSVYFEALATQRGEPKRTLYLRNAAGEIVYSTSFAGEPRRESQEAIYLPGGLQLDVEIATWGEDAERVLGTARLSTAEGKESKLTVETLDGEVIRLEVRE